MSTPSDLLRLHDAGMLNYSVLKGWTGRSGAHLASRIDTYGVFLSQAKTRISFGAVCTIIAAWCLIHDSLWFGHGCAFVACCFIWASILAAQDARRLRPELADASKKYCLLRQYSFFRKDSPFTPAHEISAEGAKALLDSGTYRHLDFAHLHAAMSSYSLADPDQNRYRGGIIEITGAKPAKIA